MNKAKLAIAIAAMLGAMGAQAETLAKADQRMLAQMAQANMAEIEAGKIALQKSQNNEVKAFAQKMIDDHGKGLQEVQAVAQSKNVTLPTEPDAKQKALAKKLNRLSGDAFDRTYTAEAGAKAHKATHAFVQKVQTDAKDADVKALAAKLEPTVAQHLGHVETLTATLQSGAPRTAATPDNAMDTSGASGATSATGGSGAGTSSAKTPKPKASADKTSGNTDHPDNPQNPVGKSPVKQ
ncbi:DUF4142 domain-containing protein [Pseudoduganella namucuonensis]|uniref:Putative membrane protein n=1 Tax=Pseudoduganella namucuonensis TaxID=1035707 RepID=A0A1I7KB91_9BURK|nr:DUF4142 domain-containing protein [Pseudoduganella namucuonensis]SFU94723.1 putative membrane protein [Pseudoduganella namucuonensis]